ncbi:uncharacterized protein BKA78DRAFT_312865 [Phyllosticta capitalensis]|uniref:uncharacterized protein n=1 Tax=Phyllosticta capitalensis TaxID=121624 RepID=UPI00313193EB
MPAVISRVLRQDGSSLPLLCHNGVTGRTKKKKNLDATPSLYLTGPLLSSAWPYSRRNLRFLHAYLPACLTTCVRACWGTTTIVHPYVAPLDRATDPVEQMSARVCVCGLGAVRLSGGGMAWHGIPVPPRGRETRLLTAFFVHASAFDASG